MATSQILEVPYTYKDLDREMCRRSLLYFAKKSWHVIEPGRRFISGWHIEAICEHLEAVTNGEIRNLLINMPPRHMKSTLVSVLWPAWAWIREPSKRWLFASYANVLSKRDSVKCRRLIESPWYQDMFGHIVQIVEDQNEKMRFENSKTGCRIATSVSGSGTGEGGDIIVVDDPHNVKEAESETVRESTLEWWDQVMSTRGNDPKTFAKVIVMQRVHEKDLSGHVLASGDYDHLCLPAEYESGQIAKTVTSIGWSDPRTKDGELLWPDNFGKDEIFAIKKALGSYAAAAQLQQSPTPSGGGIFKRHWWKTYGERPMSYKRIVQFWDCAQKVGISNDYSVCATWMETATGFYILDVWRNKVEAPQLEMAIMAQASRFSPDAVVIEDKSSGSSAIQALKQKTTLPIIAYDPKARDKEVRATAATPTVEAGNCHLPIGAEWVEEFLLEHERFPLAQHDDQVDTTSMAIEFFMMPVKRPRARTL